MAAKSSNLPDTLENREIGTEEDLNILGKHRRKRL
jgi:hypothetical protein